MKRGIRTAAIITMISALAIATTPKSAIYRNPEFGIVLPVPAGALLCTTPKGEHDHGPYMLLDTADTKGCHDLEHNRSIDVFASYNVSEDSKKLTDLLKGQCSEFAGGPCGPAPPDLGIPKLPSAAGRVDRSDGWIDIVVATQSQPARFSS